MLSTLKFTPTKTTTTQRNEVKDQFIGSSFIKGETGVMLAVVNNPCPYHKFKNSAYSAGV